MKIIEFPTYEFYWANKQTPSDSRQNIYRFSDYQKVPFNAVHSALIVIRDGFTTCYVGVKDNARNRALSHQYFDPAFTQKFLKKGRAQVTRNLKFFARCNRAGYGTFSGEELISQWGELWRMRAHTIAYFMGSQEEPTEALIREVQHTVSAPEASVLLLSPKLDMINREHVAWRKLCRFGLTRENIKNHIRKFPWLFQDVCTVDEAIEVLLLREEQAETRNMLKEKKFLNQQQTQILKKYPQLRYAVRTLQELAIFRTEVKHCFAGSAYHASAILSEIATRTGVALELLTHEYRYEDIIDLVRFGRRLSPRDLQERKKCIVYGYERGTIVALTGDHAIAFARVRVPELFDGCKDMTEIHGMSASPGKVTGRVYNLPSNDATVTNRLRKEFRGGVLVTSMTQPDIMDIASRASAIITNEGGMLCHAAIISRELGIPCVIGTKIATQVLKDGDLVEVDANKGVVRILERK